jgi:hypothetical protein
LDCTAPDVSLQLVSIEIADSAVSLSFLTGLIMLAPVLFLPTYILVPVSGLRALISEYSPVDV